MKRLFLFAGTILFCFSSNFGYSLDSADTHLSEELDRALREMDRYIDSNQSGLFPSDNPSNKSTDQKAMHKNEFNRNDFLEIGRQLVEMNRKLEQNIYQTQKLNAKTMLLSKDISKMEGFQNPTQLELEINPKTMGSIRSLNITTQGFHLYQLDLEQLNHTAKKITLFKGILPSINQNEIHISWVQTKKDPNGHLSIYKNSSVHQIKAPKDKISSSYILKFSKDKKNHDLLKTSLMSIK